MTLLETRRSRPSRVRRIAVRGGQVGALLLGVMLLLALTLGGEMADAYANRLHHRGPYDVPAADREFVAQVGAVDLHADALLWKRDLTERHDGGHVDLPRLREGGVLIQVFGIVTKVPWGQNYETNGADSDGIGLLGFLNHWSPRTWHSASARAFRQADDLREYAHSDDSLVLVTSRADLDEVERRHERGEDVLGALLGLEGLHVLEGDLANLDALFDAGVRMAGVAHFFDNEVGGSAHGTGQGGLTEFGFQVLARMDELGMIVDLAHASPAVIDDVLATTSRPVVVSHTGVAGTCPGPRNLTDDQLQAIAANGGVVGIGYWAGAVCDDSPEGIARAIVHAVQVAGPEHVALGSDFDGGVTTSFDTTGIGLLIEPLRKHGLDEATIEAVLRHNALQLFREALPTS